MENACALILAMFMTPIAAQAWTYKVLHSFSGSANDGAGPLYGTLINDKKGNLYGTTVYGGTDGNGTVFKLKTDGTLILLHSFACCGTDGLQPFGGVMRDRAGNLFGTTYFGGANNYGTVFKLAPDGTETILHSVNNVDGAGPTASLIKNRAGDLYGTASQGGLGNCPYLNGGCGTAFAVAPDGTFTKLHDFSQDDEEPAPYGSMARDGLGNLYGTTNGYPFSGTIFRLTPDGTETILYLFTGDGDGEWPFGGLTTDKAGNLFGTTQYGGTHKDGTVFKLAPDGTEAVLHSFDGNDGSKPIGSVIEDRSGNLYGTTAFGGAHNDGGVIFKLTANGKLKVLHSFDCTSDACDPVAGLLRDRDGNLYGTTYGGGTYNNGVVFGLIK